MIKFYSDANTIHVSIADLTSFLHDKTKNFNEYHGSISVVPSIIYYEEMMANHYKAISGICNSFVNEINNLNR